jgi:hypothetical protein
MTVTFAVLLQAERPQDSAEMTLVPSGMAAARRPCQRRDRTCWALFYLQRRPCEYGNLLQFHLSTSTSRTWLLRVDKRKRGCPPTQILNLGGSKMLTVGGTKYVYVALVERGSWR